MRIANKLVFIVLLLLSIVNCNKNNDNVYFNGKIKQVENIVKSESEVILTPLSLKGNNYGYIAVYDSLMFFMNPKLPNHFFNVFNVDTGEEIGAYLNKGQGPDEFIGLSPISQFYIDECELKALLFAPNEEKLLVWNISKTVKQRKNIIDTIVPYSWNKETNGANYNHIYRLDKDNLFASVQSHMKIGDKLASLPYYHKRTLYSNQLIKSRSTYRKAIKNNDAEIIPEAFFASSESLKPDRSKIVQAMLYIPQLNITNIATGETIGYRMKGSPGFSIFKRKNKTFKKYYIRTQADNNYIYATYWGKDQWDRYDTPFINTIHVFDWQGSLIHRVITDKPIGEITLDTVRNRLYTTSIATDDVYYIELSELVD